MTDSGNRMAGIASEPGLRSHPPVPDSDFYQTRQLLNGEEQTLLLKVRRCMDDAVAPVVTKYWADAAFPFDLVPAIRDLNIAGTGLQGYGCPGGSNLLRGFIAMELARVDSSIATFYGVHSELVMGSIHLAGSEDQKQKWLPSMARLEKIGCYGLAEPSSGSSIDGGFLTTARREGDIWILNGQKRWIANAPWCDVSIVWARDTDSNQNYGFIVENELTPGFMAQKIENKIALRIMQDGVITLDNCRVPEANRLQASTSSRDPRQLKLTRQYSTWASIGCSMGAYEHALKYAQTREQFGRPIASFQMIQELLAKMLGNITSSQCMAVQSAQLQDRGRLSDQHASLANIFCTLRMRETVALAREVLGGNGIVLDYNVARFFADAEALYSSEDMRGSNTLLVGEAISGFSAFA